MRYLFLVVCTLLVGCSQIGITDMLDTAPNNNIELKHSEWGYASNKTINNADQGYGLHRHYANSSINRSKHQVVGNSHIASHSQNLAQPNTNSTGSAAIIASIEAYLIQNNIHYKIQEQDQTMIHLTEEIHFNSDSSHLSTDSVYWIHKLGQYVSQFKHVDMIINGHSDDSVTASYNDQLSIQRAKRVDQQLKLTRLAKNRIFTRGYGANLPKCTNKTLSGKACNRRVELMLLINE